MPKIIFHKLVPVEVQTDPKGGQVMDTQLTLAFVPGYGFATMPDGDWATRLAEATADALDVIAAAHARLGLYTRLAAAVATFGGWPSVRNEIRARCLVAMHADEVNRMREAKAKEGK